MNLTNLSPDIRYLKDMKEVVADKNWLKTADADLELYYMYRDLAENETDKAKIAQAGLRYDITIISPIMLGREFNKTAGHDHPLVPTTNLTFPELYEVLEGEAIFLLQDSEKATIIKDVLAVKAKGGDKVIIPPNYEHLMLNLSDQRELKTANWVSGKFSSNIYKPFRAKHGFSYFALKNNSGQTDWLKNENYDAIPELKFQAPNQGLSQFDIDPRQPIYSLVNELNKLDFLNRPEKYE